MKIEILRSHLERRSAQPSSHKSGYQAFFKKQDPPKFDGDCLEYLEWKTKWKSVVSSLGAPADFELSRIKENLPEQGKKKLFGVESIQKAWDLLDKLYGDKKLISQKLQNRMKNLNPVSKESHELIIEINDEIDYLVKRLKKLDALDLLKTDNDYLNAIYTKLPEHYQHKWDDFVVTRTDSEWLAFMEFMHEIYQAALGKRTRVESLKMMDVLIQPANDDTIDETDATANESDQSVPNSYSTNPQPVPNQCPSVGEAMDHSVLVDPDIDAVALPADAPADTDGIRQTRGTFPR